MRGADKTLWTQTLLELLNHALRHDRADDELGQIVGDLRAKGYRPGVLLAKVESELGPAASFRLRAFL